MEPKLNNQTGDNNDSGSVKDNASTRPAGAAHIAAQPSLWPAEPKRAQAREGWMEKIKSRTPVRTITANEITSLSALISYAAHKSGNSEYRIERDLADRFNIANVSCLPATRFDDAMRYLVDRVPV
jgi:hypothetical protein